MDGTRKPGRFWSATVDRRQLLKTLGAVGSVLALEGPGKMARALTDGHPLTAATDGQSGAVPRRMLGKTGVFEA